jgi:hypothetical protein
MVSLAGLKKPIDGSISFCEETKPIRAFNCNERRRRISPEAGRALEKLGHAIEYLADEVVNEVRVLSGADPRIRAIQILMALNRQIFFECPAQPPCASGLNRFSYANGRSYPGNSIEIMA